MALKLIKYLICGNVLNKVLNPIFKSAKRVDFYIGWFSRYLLMKTIKVRSNRVVFFQCHNRYSCNIKSIINKLYQEYPEVEIIWIKKGSKDKDDEAPAKIIRIERFSYESYKAILSARVIIDNGWTYQEGGYVPKNVPQTLIQTWHGSLGFKRFDTDKVKTRVRAAKRHAKLTDYCISNSKFETELVYKGVYHKEAKILEFGHPRNDILFKENFNFVKLLKSKLNIPSNAVTVLYGPTFKDSKKNNNFDYDIVIEAIEKIYGKPCYILNRSHLINRSKPVYSKNVIDVSNYTDIQELMLISDIGITDYSSWLIDFSITKKLAFLFVPDIESYKLERGFYYDLNSTPYPVCHDMNELLDALKNIDINQYKKELSDFFMEKGCVEDGHATDRTVKFIISILNNECKS